jgi:HD superfamily phosphodiesterase
MISLNNKWEPILKKELLNFMNKSPMPTSTHDEYHVLRVLNYAKELSEELEFDEDVLVASIYFHDLGRHYPEGSSKHGGLSAKFAKPILEKINFPKDKIPLVLEAIKLHDEANNPSERKSVESQILYDSDKLDFSGETGIARWLICPNLRGKNFNFYQTAEYVLNNMKKRKEGMHFEKSKEMSKTIYKDVIEFFENLKNKTKL